MSEKLTRIRLPDRGKLFSGLMDHGECSAAEMIHMFRAHAARMRAQAEAIEKTRDEEFCIDVVRGSIVQHHVKVVQRGGQA